MNGKLVGSALIGSAVIGGAALYYLQVYHFYERVPADAVTLTIVTEGAARPLELAAADAIDATSSPLRFRACVTLADPAALSGVAVFDAPTPLNGPRWFDCYDAARIGAALEAGDAAAYLLQGDIVRGVDRVMAVFPDGQAFVWHQANGALEE